MLTASATIGFVKTLQVVCYAEQNLAIFLMYNSY